MLITTDASIFEITPKEVIYPNDRDELINSIRTLLDKKQSFTMRATGTSCRKQILDIFKIQSTHLPQLFFKSLK